MQQVRMLLHLADTQQRSKCAKWLPVQKIRVGSLEKLSAPSYIKRGKIVSTERLSSRFTTLYFIFLSR
jgi:hypothetical protein